MHSFLALLPALVFLAVLPLNHTNAVRLSALFALGAVALVYALRQKAPTVPVRAPLALWAGLALLSALWSANPAFSLGEFKTEIVYGMIAYGGFIVLTRDRATLHAFLAALLVGVLVTLFVSVAQIWQRRSWVGLDWDWQHGFVSYSTYLATVFPLLLYVLIRRWERKWVQPVATVMLPLFLFVGYATLNRMFWLALATSSLVVLGLAWRRQRGQRQGRWLAWATLAGLAIAGLIFGTVATQRVVDPLQTQAQPTTTLTHLVDTFTHSERFDIWRYWLGHIAERPWTGVGFGRDLPHLVYEKPPEWFDLMFAHAHNLFINYALQLGIPGAAVLIVLFVALSRQFWLMYRSTDQDISLAGATGLGVLAAMISKNMSDDLFWRTDALLFWALVGMLLGYGVRQGGARP